MVTWQVAKKVKLLSSNRGNIFYAWGCTLNCPRDFHISACHLSHDSPKSTLILQGYGDNIGCHAPTQTDNISSVCWLQGSFIITKTTERETSCLWHSVLHGWEGRWGAGGKNSLVKLKRWWRGIILTGRTPLRCWHIPDLITLTATSYLFATCSEIATLKIWNGRYQDTKHTNTIFEDES